MKLYKYASILIYVSAILFQLIGIFVQKNITTSEIVVYDWRFEQTAKNIIDKGSTKINWGVGENPDGGRKPFEMQKGEYYNWHPNGYSYFLAFVMYLGKNYLVNLMLIQILLHSLLPVLIYRIGKILYGAGRFRSVAFIASLLFMINPWFLISSLQRVDTWLICLFSFSSFYFLLKCLKNNELKYYLLLGILLSLLFFYRPIGLFPFFVIIGYLVWMVYRSRIYYFLVPALIVVMTIFSWGVRNYIVLDKFHFSYTNFGYNLWLGNNPETMNFLLDKCGDGNTIEDSIIPIYDNEMSYLQYKDEFQKDSILTEKAVYFIITNPFESLSNTGLKLLGYWSPFRVRGEHWSNSNLKFIITLLFYAPMIIVFGISLFYWMKNKSYMQPDLVNLLYLFPLLWMLPHLVFFPTQRFRAPADFALFILSADFIVSKLVNYKNGFFSR